MADEVLVNVAGSVAWLTLNRPQIGNAINVELAQALLNAVKRCETDDAVRCVVLGGSGRMFCAGGDVAALHQAGADLPALLDQVTTPLHAAMLRLTQMSKPLVTVVHGAAAGAGVGLACIGDLVLASPKASFTPAYAGIGLSPDGGATWLLPRLIGLRRAQEIVLTNRRLGAAEAAALGLVTRVVEEATLTAEAEALAQTLSQAPTGALGVTKRLLAQSFGESLDAQLNAEARSIAEQGASGEAREGIAAFMEKRTPRFGGDAS